MSEPFIRGLTPADKAGSVAFAVVQKAKPGDGLLSRVEQATPLSRLKKSPICSV